MTDDETAGSAAEPTTAPVKKAAAKRAPVKKAAPPAAPAPVEPAGEPAAEVTPEPEAAAAAAPAETPVDVPVETPMPSVPEHHDGDDGGPRHVEPKSEGLPLWQESLILVGVALVLAIVIKAFFVQAFYIPSDSMEPGLVNNDRILVEKPSYWGGGTPQRGDVVVFKDPGGWLNAGEDTGPSNFVAKGLAKVGLFPAGGHLVKRVIGVAGDTIVCCDTDGRITVNGYALDEDKYILDDKTKDCNGPMTGDCDWTAGPVPKGTIFVMGDNRANSGDSSAHLCTPEETECTQDPYVKVSSVTGKVLTLVWPLGHFGFLHRPSVFDKIPDAK